MHRNNEQPSRSRYSQKHIVVLYVELSQEIPIKISEEKDVQVSQLYSLKPKFHLMALTFLRDKGIFCGEALGHVNCTLHRFKATTETELESEEEQSREEREETDKSVD